MQALSGDYGSHRRIRPDLSGLDYSRTSMHNLQKFDVCKNSVRELRLYFPLRTIALPAVYVICIEVRE